MFKHAKTTYYRLGAVFTVGMLTSQEASANNFGKIAENITVSIENLPGLLTGLAYLFGILLGVLGVLKIKDHVENPTQTPLKDGAIRLCAGGALFALPILYEAMFETVGNDQTGVTAALLQKVEFNVN